MVPFIHKKQSFTVTGYLMEALAIIPILGIIWLSGFGSLEIWPAGNWVLLAGQLGHLSLWTRCVCVAIMPCLCGVCMLSLCLVCGVCVCCHIALCVVCVCVAIMPCVWCVCVAIMPCVCSHNALCVGSAIYTALTPPMATSC